MQRPAPTPNSSDILSIVWQKWFLELTRIFKEVSQELAFLDGRIDQVYSDITFVTQRPQYRSKTGLPTLAEQPLQTWSMWRNNADNSFSIVVRDSLGLRYFALTPLNPVP